MVFRGEVINYYSKNIKYYRPWRGATNDCGIGMLSALGYKFYDKNNIEWHYGINALSKIRIDGSYLNESKKCYVYTHQWC